MENVMHILCSWRFLDSNFFQSVMILLSAIFGLFIWKRQKHFDIAKDLVIAAKNYEQSIYELRIYFTKFRDPLSIEENMPQNKYTSEFFKFHVRDTLKNIERHSDIVVSTLSNTEIILHFDCDKIKKDIFDLTTDIKIAISKMEMYNYDMKDYNIKKELKLIFHSFDWDKEREIEKKATKIINDVLIITKRFF